MAAPQENTGKNRLARETSPYLQQHAHNPVDWYPWGPEAFDAARASGYRAICLDTLASMHDAQKLYRALGFSDIAPYYQTPIAGTVFMNLQL